MDDFSKPLAACSTEELCNALATRLQSEPRECAQRMADMAGKLSAMGDVLPGLAHLAPLAEQLTSDFGEFIATSGQVSTDCATLGSSLSDWHAQASEITSRFDRLSAGVSAARKTLSDGPQG